MAKDTLARIWARAAQSSTVDDRAATAADRLQTAQDRAAVATDRAAIADVAARFEDTLFRVSSAEFIYGGQINAVGQYSGHSVYCATDYVPIEGGVTYKVTASPYLNAYHAWYDEKKAFISSFRTDNVSALQTGDHDAPANARFARFTTRQVDVDASSVTAARLNPDHLKGTIEAHPPMLPARQLTYDGSTVQAELDRVRLLEADARNAREAMQAALEKIMYEVDSAMGVIRLRMSAGRVDWVGYLDSNGLHGGFGWDHGLQYALSSRFPMYGTGLISFHENQGQGAGSGYGYAFNASVGDAAFATTGAPAELEQYLGSGPAPAHNWGHHRYGYKASGTLGGNENQGMIAGGPGAPIIAHEVATRYHVTYGTFPAGAGASRLSARVNAAPWTTIAQGDDFSTSTGSFGMQVASLDVPASGNPAAGINYKYSAPGSALTAPFFGVWQTVEVPSRTTGFRFSSWFSKGGNSMRDVAETLITAPDATLDHCYAQIRRLQGPKKTVVHFFELGLNDRNEARASLGPGAITQGNSAQAYVDNFIAARHRIEERWAANGWDLGENFYIHIVAPPVANPDDPRLIAYRAEIDAYLQANVPRSQMIDLSALITADQLLAIGGYQLGGDDRNHLTQIGFETIGPMIIAA